MLINALLNFWKQPLFKNNKESVFVNIITGKMRPFVSLTDKDLVCPASADKTRAVHNNEIYL